MFITCPNCGKEIDDSAEICVYCNTQLRETSTILEEAEAKEELCFDELPASEKLLLEQEFLSKLPNYSKQKKIINAKKAKTLVCSLIQLVISLITLGVAAVFLFLTISNTPNSIVSIAIKVGIALVSVSIVLSISGAIIRACKKKIINTYTKAKYEYMDAYEKWLKGKGYTVNNLTIA